MNTLAARISATSDDGTLSLNPVDMNTGGASGGTGIAGANDAWLLIASDVQLTAGNTYTVPQDANSITFVSQRSHAVMWEPVPVPEAAAGAPLVGASVVATRGRRRR